MMKLAAGGSAAQIEYKRMIDEKAQAWMQIQTKFSTMGADATPAATVDMAVRHLHRKVAANRKRLSRK